MSRKSPKDRPGLLACVLACIVAVCVGWPAAAVSWMIITGVKGGGDHVIPTGPGAEAPLSLAPAWGLLASTVGWALGIGLLATLLAWPAAWVVRRRGWRAVPLMAVPLMLPTYLAYSGYGMLRAPGSLIGNWIERLAQGGAAWLPTIAGRVIAGVGLSFWAWPIAAVVLGASVRKIDQTALDALRMEAGWWRRQGEILKLSRAGLLGAIGAVTLVMMGSAVPLHLAQVPTYAVKIWLDLSLAPGSWRVWAAAWPLVGIAVAAGWVGGSRVLECVIGTQESGAGETLAAPGARGRWSAAGATCVWACSVLVPLGLFWSAIKDVRAIPRFWTLSHESVLVSAGVAGMVGASAVLIAAGVWQGLSAKRRSGRGGAGVTGVWVRALLVAGLVPGVLVGAAVKMALDMSDATRDWDESAWVLVMGHIARFGCVPALIGCWLAAIEPRQERELRALDGGMGLWGWMLACLPAQGGALLGAGLATAALSLHEIEAAIVLQPPGSPSLAQVMLNYLHQLRMQDLSAAAVVVVGGGLVVAGLAAGGMWWTARQFLEIESKPLPGASRSSPIQ